MTRVGPNIHWFDSHQFSRTWNKFGRKQQTLLKSMGPKLEKSVPMLKAYMQVIGSKEGIRTLGGGSEEEDFMGCQSKQHIVTL